MLAARAVASPPLALMPFTTSSQAGSLRLETITLAPCAAICSQIERPMPRLPPVTTATLPVRSNIMALSPHPDRLRPLRWALQQRNQLDMRRPQELIDRAQFLQPVSAILQSPRIAGEGRRIARGVDHAPRPATRQLGTLRRRTGARGIEQDGGEGVELGATERIPEEIAARHRHLVATRSARSGFHGGDGRGIVLEQRQPARLLQGQRADAGKEIGQPRRALGPGGDGCAHGELRSPGRLQKRARWRLDARFAEQQQRRAPHDDRLGRRSIAPTKPRQVGALRQRHQRLARLDRQGQATMRADQNIEPAVGLVDDGVRRSAVGQDRAKARSQRPEQGVDGRSCDHAGRDVDDPRARPLVEACQHAPALAAQHDVGATALAGCAGERRLEARRFDPALRQRAGDQLGLPGAVGVMPPVLQGAAAADLEMRAGRRLAIARRRQHLHELGGDALAAPLPGLGLDGLARQGERHEITLAALLGDPVAAPTDLQDVELQTYLYSSPPSQLLAGCISPTSRPTTLRTGGCRISSRRLAGSTPRWLSRVAMATSAARAAPSQILSATPRPSVGSMAQNTPSAPPLTWARSGSAALMRDPKAPVPAIMYGSAFIAARMRVAASACLLERRDGSAMLAIARARTFRGVASVGMPQPSVP